MLHLYEGKELKTDSFDGIFFYGNLMVRWNSLQCSMFVSTCGMEADRRLAVLVRKHH
jgi:hypothetical protein